MKSNIKVKIVLVLTVVFFILTLANINVYAEEGSFALEKETVDVRLNGSTFLSTTGGTGTTTWESSDPTVATVEDGLVQGLKIGTTTITATRGEETASCTVNVVYATLTIGANQGNSVSGVNLFLGLHPSENLFATVEDGKFEKVSNPSVVWESSDTSVVTVDSTTGKITAVKPGTAKVTATATGVSDSCDITVYAAPEITDFSNAKFETALNFEKETLKITGINPSSDSRTNYYYIITSDKTRPTIAKTTHGAIDNESMGDIIEILMVNTDENYIYTRDISKYAELNQDMYIWILQETGLGNSYYDEDGEYTSSIVEFLVEGEEVQRAELPKLNLILQTLSIGYWTNLTTGETENYTHIDFNFPTATQNRKFKLKIGKITDTAILAKIQKNDYAGITELLNYAKTHDAVYSEDLETTSKSYFTTEGTLFDGRKLLENKAYYYVYVEFDDENGKYYPIEGVTLAQAWFSPSSEDWDLFAYTKGDFQWDGLAPTDPTTATGELPQTGVSIGITLAIAIVLIGGTVAYIKYKKLKNI